MNNKKIEDIKNEILEINETIKYLNINKNEFLKKIRIDLLLLTKSESILQLYMNNINDIENELSILSNNRHILDECNLNSKLILFSKFHMYLENEFVKELIDSISQDLPNFYINYDNLSTVFIYCCIKNIDMNDININVIKYKYEDGNNMSSTISFNKDNSKLFLKTDINVLIKNLDYYLSKNGIIKNGNFLNINNNLNLDFDTFKTPIKTFFKIMGNSNISSNNYLSKKQKFELIEEMIIINNIYKNDIYENDIYWTLINLQETPEQIKFYPKIKKKCIEIIKEELISESDKYKFVKIFIEPLFYELIKALENERTIPYFVIHLLKTNNKDKLEILIDTLFIKADKSDMKDNFLNSIALFLKNNILTQEQFNTVIHIIIKYKMFTIEILDYITNKNLIDKTDLSFLKECTINYISTHFDIVKRMVGILFTEKEFKNICNEHFLKTGDLQVIDYVDKKSISLIFDKPEDFDYIKIEILFNEKELDKKIIPYIEKYSFYILNNPLHINKMLNSNNDFIELLIKKFGGVDIIRILIDIAKSKNINIPAELSKKLYFLHTTSPEELFGE